MLSNATKAAEIQARRYHNETLECPIAPEILQLMRLNGFVVFIACKGLLGLVKRRASHIIMRGNDGAVQLVASQSCASSFIEGF